LSTVQLSTLQPESEPYARQMLTEALRAYDKDDNGLIPMNELRTVFTTLGEPLTYENVEELLQLVSVDSQGKVKATEFIDMLLAQK
jgi:Ca2+-binding EF-hand superfamily protein